MTKLFKCNICGIVMDDVYLFSELRKHRNVLGKPNEYDFCAKCSDKIENFIGMIKTD